MVFVDNLALASLLHLLPYAISHRLRGNGKLRFLYFSGSATGRKLLGLLQPLGWMTGEEADYSYVDVKTANGALAGIKAQVMDSMPICHDVRSALFERSQLVDRLARRFDRHRLLLFLEKALSEEMEPEILRANVVSWYQREMDGEKFGAATYFVRQRWWHGYLQEYAGERQVRVKGYRAVSWPRHLSRRRFRGIGLPLARTVCRGVLTMARRSRKPSAGGAGAGSTPFMVAVPFTGHGLMIDPSINSDLFWVPFAGLQPQQLLVYATRSDATLDRSRYEALRASTFRGVSIRKQARAWAAVPNWPGARDVKSMAAQSLRLWKDLIALIHACVLGRGANRWMAFEFLQFTGLYVYWRQFFSSFNVRIHVDYQDWGRARVASDQAIADLGGLSVAYQRSYEAFPSVIRASTVDVHFVSSTTWIPEERLSGSDIPQFVANGYVHDHAFEQVRDKAKETRRQLQEHGAKFVVCFLDGGSLGDQRVGPSHEFRAENYRFLLEKLLADPELGLVFKPKKPSDLRERMGEVAGLLDAALATGRCFMYEVGTVFNEVFPCEASLASDVTIGLLYGSTAAFECALAGTPTLLLDRELVTYHPLYGLHEGQVVFQDWNSLWDTLASYQRNPADAPGFGDWSPVLDSLDNFQDGQASRRMGEYLRSLCDGLTRGLSREDTLEEARKIYTAQWGANTVADLRAGSGVDLDKYREEPAGPMVVRSS